MDFKKQRKIIKSLREKRSNPLLFIPCLIAELFVRIYGAVYRGIDMAFSDEKGNFMGIEHQDKAEEKRIATVRDYDREMARLDAMVNADPDDFSEKEKKRLRGRLPYRPLRTRIVSALLAAAFAFMQIPGIAAAAAVFSNDPYILEPKADGSSFTPSDMASIRSTITELDMYKNYADGANAVKLETGVFNSCYSLTTITLGYCNNNAISNNFIDIAPNSTAFIKANTYNDFKEASSQLTTTSQMDATMLENIVWDKNNQFSSQIPEPVQNFKARSAANGVVLQWDRGTDFTTGFYIYYKDNFTNKYVRKATITPVDAGTDPVFTYSIPTSDKDKEYAIRAYRSVSADYTGDESNIVTAKIASKYFNVSDEKVGALTPKEPVIEKAMKNDKISVKFWMPTGASDPTYLVLFKANAEGHLYPVQKYFPSQKNSEGIYVYDDPVNFDGSVRKYRAVAYYDALGIYTSLDVSGFGECPDKSDSLTAVSEFAKYVSDVLSIDTAMLDSPRNPKVSYSGNNAEPYWTFSWLAPQGTEDMTITYTIYVNGREYGITDGSLSRTIPIDSALLKSLSGQDLEFSVVAHAANMEDSDPAYADKVDVVNNCVQIISAAGGNQSAAITFEKFANTSNYTIYYGPSGDSEKLHITATERDCTTNSDGTLTATITGLTNNTLYEFWIMSDAIGSYRSRIVTTTPAEPPSSPMTVTATPGNHSGTISWDIVTDESGKKVAGYYVVIKKQAGNQVTAEFVPGNNYYVATGLENDIYYYAEVYSYIVIGNDPPILSEIPARSNDFMPTVSVDNILNVSAEALDTSIKVTWNSVKDATGYWLYRTDEKGTKLGPIDMGTKTTYEDKNVKNEVYYTYSVIAYREYEGKTYQSGSESFSVPTRISVSVGSAQNLVAVGADGKITITWDKTDGADGYYIEYALADSDEWEKTGDVSKPTFTKTGLENGVEYKFRVIPYKKVNGDIVKSIYEPTPVYGRAGIHLPAPDDFNVTTGDGQNTLTWTAVKGADGYEVMVLNASGEPVVIQTVSKSPAVHKNVPNKTEITYLVRAYKYVDESRIIGDNSVAITVTTGTTVNAPTDVTATAGDGTVTIKWKKVNKADGYVVYSYDPETSTFTPVGIVTSTSFTHNGLTNGRTYTYMVCAYRNINGEPVYSDYSLSVTATPKGKDDNNNGSGNNNGGGNNNGSGNNNNGGGNNNGGSGGDNNNGGGNGSGGSGDSNDNASDFRIYIVGTTPYGMSNSNLISAFTEKGALTSDIDVRFTLDENDVATIQNVLNYYGEGLESFMIYPMNIEIYKHETMTQTKLNPGYYITLTIPVPDELLPYSSQISVVHISEIEQLEILPSKHVTVSGVDCMQFTASSFSPYAFVVYLPEVGEDTGSGSFASAEGSVEVQTETSPTYMCTRLPVLYRRRMRNKVFRRVK